MLGYQQSHEVIYQRIVSGMPLLITRFGSTELYTIGVYEVNYEKKKQVANNMLCTYSGFFSPLESDNSYARFYELMLSVIPEIDILGIWMVPFERYFCTTYLKEEANLTGLRSLEPWNAKKPWTTVLKGKKVLVIHPFAKTIMAQFRKREKLFENQDILPEFTLYTVKAVQTIAEETDSGYETWFEALDDMYNKAMEYDFEVAIVGCGAYGMPLAARIKKAGRQAIHLGGVTQILFGIKGRRWDDDPVVSKLYNEYWVRPGTEERPKGASRVEGGCYW